MNVIIANKYKESLQALNIDIIRFSDGLFSVDEIIKEFKNIFYQRMILDITALKDRNDIKALQKLSINLDMDKLILLLDDSEESSSTQFLSQLISMGIYNFTRNLEGIMYLYNHPNNYRDVAQYHQLNVFDIAQATEKKVVTPSYEYVRGTRVIGVKNVTEQSGATTFIYMMKKQLEKNYVVRAFELDKKDFLYFKEPGMNSISTSQLAGEINKNSDAEVILVDVNNSIGIDGLIHEYIYLLEPSIIKLNKLMLLDPHALKKYKDAKVILNQSMINSKDLLEFEYESKLKLFYNMPPLDEREKNIPVLNSFLQKLGFDKQTIK